MSAASPFRFLILGGTTEGNILARAVAGDPRFDVLLSLAGRTVHPALPPVAVRIGGFGGVDGLVHYLVEAQIDAVIDATHPFAARISHNAAEACLRCALPRAIYSRPAWVRQPGDAWHEVDDLAAAATALGPAARRVFLTTGRMDLAPFRAAPQHHYLVRTVEPPAPDELPPYHELILARGPFSQTDDTMLMRDHGVQVLVCKNSGGHDGKIAAARALKLPVVMVRRPTPPPGTVFTILPEVLAWLADHRPAP